MASSSLENLQKQRDQVFDQMRSLDRMRRGSLSRQFFKNQPADKHNQRGPYFVLQGYLKGKKFSERIPADRAAKVAEEVQNYRRFQELAERFVSLSDQITRLADEGQDRKKNSRQKSSPKNASAKRTPS